MQHKKHKNKIVQMATMVYREKILPNKSKILWSLLAFFLIGVLSGLTVFALKKSKAASTTCYWVGDTSPANWNDATHWSDTSGGAGSTCDGGTVPGSDDDVVFDGGSTNGVTIDADINIASLTLTADYTGIFDNATNNKDINVVGNVTMDNTQTNMGGGTWTVSGDFDNKDVTTFNRDDSTINLYGESKQIVSASTKYFNHVTVFGSYEVVGTSTMGGVLSLEGDAVLTANGSSSISLGQFGGRNDIQIKSPTAKITGTGSITMNGNSKISRKDGVIDIHTIDVFFVHSASNTLVPATYESENVIIRQRVDGDFAFAFQGGLYTFNGNVKFSLDAYNRVYTIDNSANPSFVFKGDVTIENPAGGTFVWQKGNGTITIGGTSAQSLDFLNKSVEDIVISNTTAPVSLVTNGVTTDQLTVNSNATFDLNGNNLSYPSSQGTYNNGTIRLKGNETLTNVADLGANSGDVIYYGTGVSGALTLHNITFHNLIVDDASATKATFSTSTNNLNVNGNLSLTSNTGTFDNATNNKDINVTGNVTMDNTQTNMGNATWTVSGDFDNQDVGTFYKNTGTLVMNGGTEASPVNLTMKHIGNLLHHLTVSGYTTIPSSSGQYNSVYGILTVSGTLNITSGKILQNLYSAGDVRVTSTGRITGEGRLQAGVAGAKLTQKDGIIDVATFGIVSPGSNTTIVPATYESANVVISNGSSVPALWKPSAGTYTFNGNVTLYGGSVDTRTITLDNSVNNPNFVFKGNLTINNSTGAVIWQKGTGTITVGGTSTQSLNFANKSVEDIDITNTSNTVSITNDITCNSLSASDNASIAVTAGKTITTSDISNIGGSASKLVTLRSSTTGSQWYLNVSGTPVVSYVDVRDSNASGGSIIYAGETSVDSGRNTNWLFTYSYSLLSDTSSINAGSSVDFTITIKDGYNENTIPNINGVRTLIFSGANPSPSGHAPTAKDKDGNVVKFGKPTPVNFIDSVATTTLTFYCSEETSIFVTDAEPSKPNPTALTVLAPSGSLVLSAKNTTTPLDGATYLSSPDVFLNLSLSNVNTPSSAKYRVSENQSNLNASLWQPYTDSAPYSLSQQDGYVTLCKR